MSFALADDFVSGRWIPQRVQGVEFTFGADLAVDEDEIQSALRTVLGEFCGYMAMPQPEIFVRMDRALEEDAYRISIAGKLRLCGSASTPWLDWWVQHPVAGAGGRLGGGQDRDYLDQVQRAFEEVLWDDPGLVAQSAGAAESIKERFLAAGAVDADRWAKRLAQVARRRIPLPSGEKLQQCLKADSGQDETATLERLATGLLPNQIEIRLGPEIEKQVRESWHAGNADTGGPLDSVRARLLYQYGVAFPEFKLRSGTDFGPRDYQIVINGLPRTYSFVPGQMVCINMSDESYDSEDRWVNPLSGEYCGWVAPRQAGEGGLSAADFLLRHLEACLREAASDFVDLSWTERQMENLRYTHPHLLDAMPYSREFLASVLHELAAGRVPICDLPRLIKRLVELETPGDIRIIDADGVAPETGPASVAVAEALRPLMWNVRSSRNTQRWTLGALSLDPKDLIPAMRTALRSGGELASNHSLAAGFLRSLGATLPRFWDMSPPALLVPADIRRHIQRLISAQFPAVEVVCPEDLSTNTSIQRLGTVSLEPPSDGVAE